MVEHSVSVHDRGAGQSSLVYPVVSRRSGGLSVGINLFPDRKRCNFDCPYCEVLPFAGDSVFSSARLEAELEAFFARDYGEAWAGLPVRDLCISGNGEATLSPQLWEALDLCARARRRHPAIAGEAPIVIITNSTGFLDGEIARRLAAFARVEPLKIWAKLDAGSQEGFAAMSRSPYKIDDIVTALGEFARGTPTIIQTMVCGLEGGAPGRTAPRDAAAEALAYARRINDMLERGALIEAIHVYTLARLPLESWVRPLLDEAISRFMGIVSGVLVRPLPVFGFGERDKRITLKK